MRTFGALSAHALLAALVSAGVAQIARAQVFPDRPIHILIGNPNGSSDGLAHYFGDELAKRAHQRVVIDLPFRNKPDAAMKSVLRAEPDGYTLLFISGAPIVADRFFSKDAKPSTQELTPIASCARAAFALVVSPEAPVKTIHDLVEKLKVKKQNAYGFVDETSLMASELFKQATEASAEGISYARMADEARDVADGTLDFGIVNAAFAADQVKRGALKALAVTSKQRASILPDTPTMIEAGVDNFAFAPWWGVYAPPGVPSNVAAKLETLILQIDADPRTAVFLDSVAATPLLDGSVATRARLDAELRTWPSVARVGGPRTN